MKKIKRILIAALVLVLALGAFPDGAMAADETEGKCGDEITYSFAPETGVMTISGAGRMWDYFYADESGVQILDREYAALCGEIRELVIEEGVTYIGMDAFEGCENLKKVTFAPTVMSIGQFAFLGTGLEEIDIPEGIGYVGTQAFSNCRELKRASLPSTIRYLAQNVFAYDDALELLEIGGCCAMPAYGGTAAFCPALTQITVAEDNPLFSLKDGVLFYETILWQYPGGSEAESYVIPGNTTAVILSAFAGAERLKAVFIPLSVTEIGEEQFVDSGVTDVYYEGTEQQWAAISAPDNLLTPRSHTEAINIHYQATVAEMEKGAAEEPPHPKKGDVNADGSVTAEDARLALRASVSLEQLTEEQTAAADTDGDGAVSAEDARMILRASVHMDSFG